MFLLDAKYEVHDEFVKSIGGSVFGTAIFEGTVKEVYDFLKGRRDTMDNMNQGILTFKDITIRKTGDTEFVRCAKWFDEAQLSLVTGLVFEATGEELGFRPSTEKIIEKIMELF